jgi:hypothetical protein
MKAIRSYIGFLGLLYFRRRLRLLIFILEFYMKKIVAMLVAGLFSAGVFAQAAPAKKEEPKKDAKPAAAAPAAKPADKK